MTPPPFPPDALPHSLPPAAAVPGVPRAAVFIDRDGTLVENVPYNVDPAQLRFTEEAVEGLLLLQAFGYALVLVTNQPGVGLGLFTRAQLDELHDVLHARLAAEGVALTGVFACPHPPGHRCGCRKPEPGLLLRAASELDLDLARSWMIGDILDDVEAGTAAGCRSVLLDVGNETVWRDSPRRRPTVRARTLFEAAREIIERSRATPATTAAPATAGVPAALRGTLVPAS